MSDRVRYDSHAPTTLAIHDWDDDKELIVTIFQALQDALDKTVEELPPLQDQMDIDALERLFHSRGADFGVSHRDFQFSYEGCRVSIREDGIIRVTPDYSA